MPTITGRLAGQTGFRELFGCYYPVICRQLTCLLGNRDAAEDVAQETFIKLYQSPAPGILQFRGGWPGYRPIWLITTCAVRKAGGAGMGAGQQAAGQEAGPEEVLIRDEE